MGQRHTAKPSAQAAGNGLMEPCTHFWRIAPPEGPTSEGVCLWCGAERTFLNSLDDYGPERRVAAHTMYSTPGEPMGARLMAEAYRE